MGGDGVTTAGVSSRRSACNRCRLQKLRCLRANANADGRCDRCVTADAQSVTSPIYRMRNCIVVDDTSPALASAYKRRHVVQSIQDAVDEEPSPSTAPQNEKATSSLEATDAASKTPEWLSAVTLVSTLVIEGSSSTFALVSWPAFPAPYRHYYRCSGGCSGHRIVMMLSYLLLLRTSSPIVLAILVLALITARMSTSRELSRHNLDLASQLSRMVSGPLPVTLKTLIDPNCGSTNPSGAVTSLAEDIITITL